MSVSLSIIIPTLNEAQQLPELLHSLSELREAGAEIIVADGGSEDGTVAALEQQETPTKVVTAAPGRARQMNAGAACAGGEWLVFLHADTRLPPEALALLTSVSHCTEAQWGFFPLKLSGSHRLLRLVESLICYRSRVTCIATGDQALFVRRRVFESLNGFADIPLMEDVELCKRLRKRSRPVIPNRSVLTSSRRWETRGIVATIVRMWCLRGAYACGVSPRWLAKHY